MSENEKNIPKRRFKEFGNANAWEQRKLGDILSLENGFAFKSKFFQEENSTTIVLTPGNVAIGGGFENDKGRYYNVAGIFPKQFIFNPGDVFVTMTDLTPSAQTLGFPAIVPNDGIEYLHNQRLGKIVSYDYNNLFLFYLLCTDNYHNYVVSTASGTTVKHTSPERILDYNCYIPQKDEQCKIASCFREIDNLITLHQRKLEKMKALKKAYLTDMLPAEGESKPKLRFAGFTDEWEQCTFGDLAQYKKGPFGSALKKDIFVPKTSECIKVYEQQNAIKKNWKLERYFITEAYANKLNAFEVHAGDIIVSCAGTIGEIYVLPSDAEDGIINQALMRIRVNEDLIDRKLFKYLFSNMIDVFSKIHSNGSAMKNIPPFADLKPTSVYVPSKHEQRKVVLLLTKIDRLITLNQHKLDKLQNIKKAYLNEMFI